MSTAMNIYSSGHGKVPIPFPLNAVTVCVPFPLRFHRTSVAFAWLVGRVSVCVAFVFHCVCVFIMFAFLLRLRSYCVCVLIAFVFLLYFAIKIATQLNIELARERIPELRAHIKRDGQAGSYRLLVHGGSFKTLGEKKFASSRLNSQKTVWYDYSNYIVSLLISYQNNYL